ncbi:MAG: MtrB/PioB family decaheme-associated outer membrane protein [Ectothiorhodospira sp.]
MHIPRKTLVIGTLCTLGLLPPQALRAQETPPQQAAQQEGADQEEGHQVQKEIRLGLGYLDEDAPHLGRYTGLNQEGIFPDLGFEFRGRDPHNSGRTRVWSLEGRHMGLDNRRLELNAKEQGRRSGFFYYRETPNHTAPDLGTPYRGSRSGNLRLPSLGGAENAGDHLNEVDAGTRRRGLGAGGEIHLNPRWSVRSDVHQDRKDGIAVRGVNNGHFWSQQRSALVPVPVDHKTTRFNTELSYDGEHVQGRLGYHLSRFSQEDGQDLVVPDATADDWSQAPTRTVSQAPDNQFHQVTGSLGYSFGDTGRVGADLALGRMTQDTGFVMNTPGLPDHLNGRIDTTLVNLRTSGRPHPRLNLRAAYRHDDRDNRTDPYSYQVELFGQNRLVTTRPVSQTQDRIDMGADYRLLDRTHLTLGLVREEWERTYTDREHTDETAYTVGLRSRALPRTTLRAELTHARQRGDQWERTTVPEALRKTYLADRDRQQAALYASLQLTERFQITPRVQWVDDDYLHSELGLRGAERQIWALDASYVPTERLTGFAFYAFEHMKARQAGLTAPGPAQPAGTAWRADREDDSLTLGFGGEYEVRPDRLTVGSEVMHIESSGRARTVSDGPGGGVYPSLETRLTQFSIYGEYHINDQLDLRLRYMAERYREKDWGIDGIGVQGPGNLILLDEESPDYTAHLIAGAIRYRF